jgi:NADH:ubiquinone oxidoreductase subunit 3 (subunit A)
MQSNLVGYLTEYLPVLVFIAIAIGLSIVIVLIPYFLAVKKPDNEKLSAYECGFDPFGDARGEFDVRFYLVAILFIIFDNNVFDIFAFVLLKIFYYSFFLNISSLFYLYKTFLLKLTLNLKSIFKNMIKFIYLLLFILLYISILCIFYYYLKCHNNLFIFYFKQIFAQLCYK